MAPRADFQCAKCETKIEDLPVDAKCCPLCGRKRGFIRLFTGCAIIGSAARQVDKVIQQTMDPLYEKHAATTEGARRFETEAQAALDRSVHEAPASERAKAQPFGGRVMPAGAALSSISPQARQDSREVIYPALTNRRVRPDWS
jgi:hypothetical protein